MFPLVLDYNSILPDIQNIIRKHVHLIRSSPQITEISPAKKAKKAKKRKANQEMATWMVQFLTLLNAKCNLDKICVHKVFALVHEDPKDRLDIHICFLKVDRKTRRNLQNYGFQET